MRLWLSVLRPLVAVVAFAMLGMLSPASRGALMTAALFLFVFMGYASPTATADFTVHFE